MVEITETGWRSEEERILCHWLERYAGVNLTIKLLNNYRQFLNGKFCEAQI